MQVLPSSHPAFDEPDRRMHAGAGIGDSLSHSEPRWLDMGLALLLAAFFIYSLSSPIGNTDPYMYSEVGRAIYQKGLLPYTYVFDHKPVMTYYLYGLVAIIFPPNLPVFQFLSLLAFAGTALVTRYAAGTGRYLRHFLLVSVLSIGFMRFSGNTEIFFSPLALLSLTLVMREKSAGRLILAGVVAAIAFNINYLAFFLIGPPIIFHLATCGDGIRNLVVKLFWFAIGFAAGFFLVFLPFLLQDPSLISRYFSMQAQFLSGYGGDSLRTRSIWNFAISVAPMFALVIFSWPGDPADRKLRNTMVVLFLSAFVASMTSNKFYYFYSHTLVAPLVVLFCISTGRRKIAALVVALPVLSVIAAIVFYRAFAPAWKTLDAYDFSKYEDLKRITQGEKVMSLRSSILPVYFADMQPSHKLIWPNHAYVMYGAGEDDYYLGEILKNPKFVITNVTICDPDIRLPIPKTCGVLGTKYRFVKQVDDISWEGMRLYQRIEG